MERRHSDHCRGCGRRARRGDDTTRVDVNTELKVTGKVAQFGRGVMADVSGKLMGQFADNLHDMLDEHEEAAHEAHATAAAPATDAADTGSSQGNGSEPQADSGPRQIDAPEAEAVDLLEAAGSPVLKRVAPIIGLVVVLLILRRLLRKK